MREEEEETARKEREREAATNYERKSKGKLISREAAKEAGKREGSSSNLDT